MKFDCNFIYFLNQHSQKVAGLIKITWTFHIFLWGLFIFVLAQGGISSSVKMLAPKKFEFSGI